MLIERTKQQNFLTESGGMRGGAAYLGKDLLGNVRGASNEHGLLEDRYEYGAFGKPYKGDLESGMNLGYTGKPYDGATGIYDYGYRDYKPEAARFTTVDPIRDGSNWFAYVNNDPVNYIDPFGLSAGDKSQINDTIAHYNSKQMMAYALGDWVRPFIWLVPINYVDFPENRGFSLPLLGIWLDKEDTSQGSYNREYSTDADRVAVGTIGVGVHELWHQIQWQLADKSHTDMNQKLKDDRANYGEHGQYRERQKLF